MTAPEPGSGSGAAGGGTDAGAGGGTRLDRALQAWLAWREGGEPGDPTELLARHPDLLDLLEPMLDQGADDVAGVTVRAGAEDAPLEAGEPHDGDAVRGRTLGDFRLVRELGRGGMGVVYEAQQVSLGRRVALKVLPGHLTLQASSVARFRREAETAARLHHPGIVAVHAVAQIGEAHFFAMDLVDGAPLDRVVRQLAGLPVERLTGEHLRLAVQTLRRPRRPPAGEPAGDATSATGTSVTAAWRPSHVDTVVSICIQVAEALEHAHAAGVIHRDVKPSNVILRPEGRAVLTDFGLAREQGLPSISATGEFAGTPSYVSPEQARAGADPVDRRTDLFSLGATLYELLTLRRPFPGDSSREVLDAILHAEPRDPGAWNPALPADLVAVVQKALEKDPERRYGSAAAMAADLRAFLARRPVSARRVGRVGRLARWCRRNPVVAALSAAVAAVSVGGVAWILRQNVELGASVTALRRTRDDLAATVADLRRMSDLHLVRSLGESRLHLRAAGAEDAPALQAWLDTAQALVARRPLHESTLQALRQRGRPLGDGGGYAFDDPTDRWQHDTLVELAKELDAFVAEPGGAISGVRRWRAFVDEVERRSLAEPAAAWRETTERIADPRRSPAYRGLRIVPQLGLVPLGPDPRSGLEEFAHLLSGEVPERDGDGELRVGLRTGIVLVLLPGGRTTLGSRPPDDEHPLGAPFVDPGSHGTEQPLHEVDLDPYFIGKYEVTHWQFLQGSGLLRGTAPEQMRRRDDERGFRLPVETVNWSDADAGLRAMGLVLPSEARWEHAARGGTTTPWYAGEEPESLFGHANLRDRSYIAYLGQSPADHPRESAHDDGWVATAPVGSFLPNPFGLHDVHGNVSEWTLDTAQQYTVAARTGDGLRPGGDPEHHMVRGGSYEAASRLTRAAARSRATRWMHVVPLGMRAARDVDPP